MLLVLIPVAWIIVVIACVAICRAAAVAERNEEPLTVQMLAQSEPAVGKSALAPVPRGGVLAR